MLFYAFCKIVVQNTGWPPCTTSQCVATGTCCSSCFQSNLILTLKIFRWVKFHLNKKRLCIPNFQFLTWSEQKKWHNCKNQFLGVHTPPPGSHLRPPGDLPRPERGWSWPLPTQWPEAERPAQSLSGEHWSLSRITLAPVCRVCQEHLIRRGIGL